MAIYEGNTMSTVSSSSSALGTAWASLTAASQGKAYQVLGILGGASAMACHVELIFGGAKGTAGDNKLRFYANSHSTISEYWGNLGPITPKSVAVKTYTAGSAAKECWANLLYRIVL